jgi:hypothetical protein
VNHIRCDSARTKAVTSTRSADNWAEKSSSDCVVRRMCMCVQSHEHWWTCDPRPTTTRHNQPHFGASPPTSLASRASKDAFSLYAIVDFIALCAWVCCYAKGLESARPGMPPLAACHVMHSACMMSIGDRRQQVSFCCQSRRKPTRAPSSRFGRSHVSPHIHLHRYSHLFSQPPPLSHSPHSLSLSTCP